MATGAGGVPQPRKSASHARRRPGGPTRPGAVATYAVVAGVVLVGVAAYFATREAPPSPEPPPPPAERPPPPDPNALRRDEAQHWFTETFLDDMWKERPLPGKRIDELLEEGKKRGYDAIPGFDWPGERKKVYERLLRREPDHPEANRVFGRTPLSDYPEFYEVFRRLTDAKSLPADLKGLRDQYEDKVRFTPRPRSPAVEPEEYRRVAALLDQFKALDDKFTKDPTYKAICEALDRVRIDPILGKYETVHVEMPPFVLFYGSRELKAGQPDVARKLTARLESFRRLIEDLLAFHRERWIKPLGLKEFVPGEVFFVWVFGDKESWEDYGRQVVTVVPRGTKGYFSNRDHWAFVYDDPKERYEVEAAVAHELTHLLHWHYSKDPASEFQNHYDHIDAVWFKEGWAEYVSWVKRDGDGYVFAQDSPLRMEAYQAFKKLGLPLYPLQEFVKRESYADWAEAVFAWLGKKIKLPEEPKKIEALWDAYFDMLYSQSWLFVKFLYEGEGGKYQKKMLEFTKASIRGYLDYHGERGYARAHEVFGQIFELKTNGDWDRFQAEFDRFLEAKLYEIPPPK